jgi:hypothetical protein
MTDSAAHLHSNDWQFCTPYTAMTDSATHPAQQWLTVLHTRFTLHAIGLHKLLGGNASGLFHLGSPTQILQPPTHVSPPPKRATCPTHITLLYFITFITSDEVYKLRSYTWCNFLHYPVTPSLLGPNILLSTWPNSVLNSNGMTTPNSYVQLFVCHYIMLTHIACKRTYLKGLQERQKPRNYSVLWWICTRRQC